MATTAPIGEKRDRDGDSVCPIVQAYKANHRSQWPTEAELDKLAADVTATASAGDKAGNEAAVKALAIFIYRNHDTPHASKLERWYVSGHLGTAKSDPKTAYSFFAAFFRLHVAGDEYAYCVHWAITEAPAVPNASASFAVGGVAAAAAAGATTTTAPMPPAFAPGAPPSQAVGKYHTFASQDPSTPAVIAQLHSQGKFKTADARVTQQILSMAKGGCIAAPEKMFAEGAAFVRGAASGEGPTAANGFETLYVEIDGNSFSASMPEGADSPTYTLKLRGESQNNLENNGKNDANGKGFDISLDLTFSPMVSAGFGPILHGRKGVVSVDNFDDDMFYYFSPRCALVGAGPAEREAAALLSIDGVRIPLTFANGEDERIWVDHEFGGHPPTTIEEMAALAKAAASATPTCADYSWDWGAFHVPGLGSVSMAIVREGNDAIPPNIWGTVVPEYSLPPSAAAVARGETKGPIAPPFAVYFDGTKAKDDPSQPIRIETDPTVPPFSSPDSGMFFPTAFITHIPAFKNLRLRTVAAISNQEFINMIAKPSYLQGRANVEASWEEEVEDAETKTKSTVVRRSLCGMGFSETRGALNKAQIEQVAMLTHATVFMPVEMQPAPPAALLPALPGAILPTVTATLSMMVQSAPPPKPKANQVAFIAATVAAYSSILRYGSGVSSGPAVSTPAEADANAARFVKWWAEEKRAFLTNTSTPLLRAGVKDIGMCAMMTRELEGVIARTVPSVVAAIAANPATSAEAALNFILNIETAVENEADAFANAWRSRAVSSLFPLISPALSGQPDSSGGSNQVSMHSKLRDILPAEVLNAIVRTDKDADALLDTMLAHWARGPPENFNFDPISVVLCEAAVDAALQRYNAAVDADLQRRTFEGLLKQLSFQGIQTLGDLNYSRDSLGEVAAPLLRLMDAEAAFHSYLNSIIQEGAESASGLALQPPPTPWSSGLPEIELTARVQPFAGEDRTQLVRAIIDELWKSNGPKESNPIHVITAAPRMGKSRVLMEIARDVELDKAPGMQCVSVTITLNSHTPLDVARVTSVNEALKELIARAISVIALRFLSRNVDFSDVIVPSSADWGTVWSFLGEVLRVTQRRKPESALRMVLIVDEFSNMLECRPLKENAAFLDSRLTQGLYSKGSLVVSGFTKGHMDIAVSKSGRPLRESFLSPILANHSGYADIRESCRSVCTYSLYNAIRFAPGLMGYAIELSTKPLQCGKVKELKIPVLDRVKPQWPKLSAGYWRHAANEITLAGMGSLSSDAVKAVEDAGVVLHVNGPPDVSLNPFFDFALRPTMNHPLWEAYESWTNTVGKKSCCPNERKNALHLQGKALEGIIMWSMVLRAAFTKPFTMSVGSLVRLIGGPDLVGGQASTSNSLLLSFGHQYATVSDVEVLEAVKKLPLRNDLVSFPCHSEGDDNGKPRNGTEVARHAEKGRAFIKSAPIRVAQPTAAFNKGCDVVSICDLQSPDGVSEERKCCFLFETRFWDAEGQKRRPDHEDHHKSMTNKICHSLLGIMANYRGQFRRVVFIYLTTDDGPEPNFDFKERKFSGKPFGVSSEWKTVNAMLPEDLRITEKRKSVNDHLRALHTLDPKCEFTVHCVRCPLGKDTARFPSETFCALTLNTYAYLCPAFEIATLGSEADDGRPAPNL